MIESELRPEALLRVLADPRLIPRWAPAFADDIEAVQGCRWTVTKAKAKFEIEVDVSLVAQTASYLREVAPGKFGGAVLNILSRIGGGSVVYLSLPLPPGSNRTEVTATLNEELVALMELSQSIENGSS